MELNELKYDELKDKARELDIEFTGNPKREELEILVEEALVAEGIKAKEATYDKPSEESKSIVNDAKSKAQARQEALRMIKCVITPLDNRMKDVPSEMFATGNKNLGFIKKVVKFNKTTIEPKVIIDLLKEKKMLIQETSEVKGKLVTRKRLVPAFNVQEMEFTKEELEEISNKGKK